MSKSFEEQVEALASELGEQIARLAKDDKEMTDGLAIAAIALIDSAVELDEVFEEFDEDEFGAEWDDDEEEYLYDSVFGQDDDLFGRSSIEDTFEDQ